jgi:hypothetical protein
MKHRGKKRKYVTHIYVGSFRKCTNWMHVVVQNDDPHHHSQAEHDSFFILEFTSIVSEEERYEG